MIHPAMTIGGAAVRGAATFDVIDAVTGQLAGTAPDCSAAELDRAVEAAASAHATWVADRRAPRQVLLAASVTLKDAVERIGDVLTAEQGKQLAQAPGEVAAVASALEYWSASSPTPR